MRLVGWWGLWAAILGWLVVNCGSVTLEPLPPDDPLPEAGPPPRLVRSDAGSQGATNNPAEDNSPP
jgi:hypothetical protein